MRIILFALAAYSFLVVPGPASATLTEVDLVDVGDGLVTRDDVTGLDWLDLTETMSLSFDDILCGAGGWVAGGWRHANGQEVCFLFNEVQDLFDCSSPLARQTPSVTVALWVPFQDLIGITDSDPAETPRSIGSYDQEEEGSPDSVGLALFNLILTDDIGAAHLLPNQLLKNTSSAISGNWLVRVPEPSMTLLGGAALLVLAGLRRIRA